MIADVMRPSFCIRTAESEDADRLAVLATQVWLHTYATDGITTDIAEYVLRELTPEKYLSTLSDPSSQVFVAESGESLAGLAVVKFDTPCPTGNYSSAELQTLYVQEHFVGHGAGKSLLQRGRSHGKAAIERRAVAFSQREERQGHRLLCASGLHKGRHYLLRLGRGAS